MAKIFGRDLSRRQILERVGDISQLARITDYRFQSGREEGMRSYEVTNGSGLSFTVLPSRALDIAWASYKGIPISFISKSGLADPKYYEKDGLGFLRSFSCGLMTTCGLTYMGSPSVDQGEELGLHGRISNISSKNTSASSFWQGDDFLLQIRGETRESSIFGENMVIYRKIETLLGSNTIHIRDRIRNEGFEETPFMLLYHCNFGYPLIDSKTEISLKESGVKARDPRAQEGLEECFDTQEPEEGFTEQVYFVDMDEDKDGFSEVIIENRGLLENGLRLKLSFNKETLPYTSIWKQMGQGDYVFGIEPGTWIPEGRKKARERGELIYLSPLEEYQTDIYFTVEEID